MCLRGRLVPGRKWGQFARVGSLRHGVVGLPKIGGGLPLEVLMLWVGETGFLISRRAILGVCRTVLWYHGRSLVVPWYCQARTGVPGAILSIANAFATHTKPKAEVRKQNPAPKATPMRHQSHLKATLRPVDSQLIATLKRLQSPPNASTMRP